MVGNLGRWTAGHKPRPRNDAAREPYFRVPPGVIIDDFAPGNSTKPLKSKEPEKRPNHRQKSSFVVRTTLNQLIQKAFQ
jgi:hypothetical protein